MKKDKDTSATDAETVDLAAADTEQAGPNLQLYDITIDSIDIYATNRQPGTRDFSLTWDKTLFYLLEDVTPEDTDGQIEKYDLTGKELLNARNGNQIVYEIYRNQGVCA